MKRYPILTAVAATMLLLFSCKNKNTSGLAIPKDAAMVFHINTSSLASKLSWDEIKSSAWFKEAYQKADDQYAQKLMENPDASGIDIRKDFAFFVQRRGRGGIAFFEGSVKDAAAFEALCKKLSKTEKTEKSGEWNMLTADGRSVIAWNKDNFAVINDMPFGNMNPMMGGQTNESTSFSTDSLKVILKQVMASSGSNSLFDDDRFADLAKESGDMHLWVNSSSIYGDMAGMLSMLKAGNLLSGNATAATVNFDDGKISMKAKTYMNKDMQELMKKWSGKNVDAAVLNRIPSDSVVGAIAANVDPQSLQEFFKAVGFDGFINMALSKQNLTMNELFFATKGEFVLAFSDLSMQNQTVTLPGGDGDSTPTTFTSRRPDFNVLFATNVNQRATFDKLLNTFTAQSQTPPFSYKLNNDWFVAANKPQAVDAFLAGNGSKKAFAEKISGHPFGMYLDFQRLLKTNFTEEATAKGMLSESAAMWKDLVATGGEYKDGATTAEVVVNLVDPKTNSLKQLNRYFGKMYAETKKAKLAYEAEPQIMDTTAVPPVATSPK